ncbi:MAG: IS110 family transposase [Xanthomonadales bacterium]|nr:IS110 family transposase [Xanthomonadales bacterium]NIX13817.1 IS110 family transposase [Xanthomonadales bacterium]
MTITQIGIDIGKNTFHVIGLDAGNAIALRRQFSRSGLLRFFAEKMSEPADIAFEACSGAHWLAHRLIALGHRVMLLTPESVRPFAKAQKNDWNDALAIAEAARRPGRHAVGVKSEEQLDMQALHRVRQRLVTARTAIINQLRGLMRERGIVAPGGRARFERFVRDQLLGGDVDLSPVSRALFATLDCEYETISARLTEIDRQLEAFARENPVCRALLPIPGIGFVVATALYSAVANISDFRTGRDLAAFLGLVPRQRSTGGKTILLGISKRGNSYVRTLMIHGMRSAFHHRARRDNRMTQFMERMVERGLHTNKIVVVSANKAARIVWAVLAKNETYRPAA